MTPEFESAVDEELVGRPGARGRDPDGSWSAPARGVETVAEPPGLVPRGLAPRHASLSPEDARKAWLQAGIRRQRAACGCELGSLFLIVATVAYLACVGFGVANWSAAGTLWRGIVFVLSSAVIGKLLGLAYAGVRLHQLRRALRREFGTSA